jgi:hypothetical protein
MTENIKSLSIISSHFLIISEIHEKSGNFHNKLQDFFRSFKKVEKKSALNQKKAILSETNEEGLSSIQEIIEKLIQNDSILKAKCDLLIQKLKILEKILQFPSTLKDPLEDIKLLFVSYKRSMKNSLKKLSSNFHYLEKTSKNKYLKTFVEGNEKLKTLLTKVLPEDVFIHGVVKMKDDFFEKFEAKPNENLNFFTRLKKLKDHSNMLSNLSKFMIRSVVDIYNQNLSKINKISPPKFIYRSSVNSPQAMEGSLQKKNIIRKISKLVIRGSLTEEEAGRVISNLNEAEYSVVQNEEEPLTETRVKTCQNKSSLYIEAEKTFSFQKKNVKSNERLKRRKSNKPILRYLSSSFISPSQIPKKSKASSFL